MENQQLRTVLLETTGVVSAREAKDQILDDLELERERGITIKSHAIQMHLSIKRQNRLCSKFN